MGGATLLVPKTGGPSDRAGDMLLWCGVALMLVPQLVRATSNSTTFPGWDQDPVAYSLTAPALTPGNSMVVDALTLVGAAALTWRALTRGIRLNVPVIALGLIGCVGVVLHGWLMGPAGLAFRWSGNGAIGDQRIGSAWMAAILAGVALWHAAQEQRVRRIVAGALLGFVALLAIHGAAQVYVIHAQTMAEFKADPDRFILSRGWARDSSMAKSFIRRLSQPEASGWFGLANVYASFAAAGAVAGGVLLLDSLGFLTRGSRGGAERRLDWKGAAILGGLAACAAAALYLAHSKGGFLAVGGACAAGVTLAWGGRVVGAGRARVLAVAVGLAAIVGPIVLVWARGKMGEHALGNERSLLFRSFYMEAFGRIFAEHPVAGVGPDGFQRAFTITKPPLCPEEVQSPHCVPLDWLADLGVLGLAWVLLLGRLAIGAARNVAETPGERPGELLRNDARLAVLVPVIATLAATFLESPFITPDIAVVRVGGLVAWAVCAWGVARAMDGGRATWIALAVAALAMVAHAQIDVTGSFPTSAGPWMMLIATAGAPWMAARWGAHAGRAAAIVACVAVFVVAVLVGGTALVRVRTWESHLDAAARIVRPIAEISERLTALAKPPTPGTPATDSIEAITRDLRTLTGDAALQPTPASINGARVVMLRKLLPQAAEELEAAYRVYPDQRLTLREASRLHLQLAMIALETGRRDEARGHFDRAERVLRLSDTAGLESVAGPAAPELQWLASIQERRAEMLGENDARPRAIQTRLRMVPIDPYNLDNALKLFRDCQKQGDAEQARAWATRALELHEYTRLDRETRGLSEADLEEVRRAASGAGGP